VSSPRAEKASQALIFRPFDTLANTYIQLALGRFSAIIPGIKELSLVVG
jgi:hypothetical protein